MKIVFIPDISGFSFLNLKEGDCLFNYDVKNLAGLLDLLQMYSGVNVKVAAPAERLVRYYHLLREYIKNHGDCVLAKSFGIDGLNTARKCLTWRDEMRMAGWTAETPAPTKRFEVLADIERNFDMPSTFELLKSITDAVEKGCALPENLEIEIPCKVELMRPAVQDLLKALEGRGVKVCLLAPAKQKAKSNLKYVTDLLVNGEISGPKDESGNLELSPDDKSFNILNFETIEQALAYLSTLPADKYDVWVNGDNKLLDNWLHFQGKPTAGSTVRQTVPQTLQLLTIGVGLFSETQNLKNLVEWLNTGVNPLPRKFRQELCNEVTARNGFFNPECESVIQNFIDEDKNKNEKLVKTFLPVADHVDLSEFVDKFVNWCRQFANVVDDELLSQQLFAVANQADVIAGLLKEHQGEEISLDQVQTWLSILVASMDYPQYDAQVGSRTVVHTPANIVGIADETIYCDFYGEEPSHLTYDFLTEVERNAFAAELRLWNRREEMAYNQVLQAQYLSHTKKRLSLVTVNRIGVTATAKRAAMISLEKKVSNLAAVTETPEVKTCELASLRKVDNRIEANASEIKIKHQELLKWPSHQSFSALDVLINNPFDYVFSNLAHIEPKGLASLSGTHTVKGVVAHGIVEQMLGENKRTDFDEVFEEQVMAYGAILLSDENKMDLHFYKNEVHDFVEKLKAKIAADGLTVVACEKEYTGDIGLADNVDVTSFLDMLLVDKDGKLHIWDFKWYPSGGDKYKSLIAENRFAQLAIYQKLVESIEGKGVAEMGYMLIPSADFLKVGDGAALIEQINNSYQYRREQISRGKLEIADGFAADDFNYGVNTANKNLLPLKYDHGAKVGNGYSKEWDLLKGRKPAEVSEEEDA